MTDKEILKKAFWKALNSGWTNEGLVVKAKIRDGDNEIGEDFFFCTGGYANPEEMIDNEIKYYSRIIFSHDFAKAFWGDPEGVKYYMNTPKRTPVKIWQYHLQQMVLEEEPIKYLEKFI